MSLALSYILCLLTFHQVNWCSIGSAYCRMASLEPSFIPQDISRAKALIWRYRCGSDNVPVAPYVNSSVPGNAICSIYSSTTGRRWHANFKLHLFALVAFANKQHTLNPKVQAKLTSGLKCNEVETMAKANPEPP
jgi:hypothetical protein